MKAPSFSQINTVPSHSLFPKTCLRWASALALIPFQVQFQLQANNYFKNIYAACLNILRELGKCCITIRDLGSSSKIVLGSSREILKYFGDGKIWAPCPPTHIHTHHHYHHHHRTPSKKDPVCSHYNPRSSPFLLLQYKLHQNKFGVPFFLPYSVSQSSGSSPSRDRETERERV